MARKNTRHNIVMRCLAAMALLFVYFVSTSAVLVGTSTTAALARGGRGGGGRGGGGWGRGGGYGRGGGWGRGRGYGYGGVYVAPAVRGGCYYSYRWGRTICRGYPY
jgi:hypothetical protein